MAGVSCRGTKRLSSGHCRSRAKRFVGRVSRKTRLLWPRTLPHLHGALNLDRNLIWQGYETDRRPSVPTRLAEDLDEQVGAAVYDFGLVAKVGGAIDHAEHFHHASHAVKIAEGRPGRGQDLQTDFARGGIAFLDGHRAAEFAALRF